MLIAELRLPPQVFDEWPQALIDKILVYKGVKGVTQYGGEWQP